MWILKSFGFIWSVGRHSWLSPKEWKDRNSRKTHSQGRGSFQELVSQCACWAEGLKDRTQQFVLYKYLYFIDIMQMGTEYLPAHLPAFYPPVIEE